MLKFTGQVKLILRDEHGDIKNEQISNNIVVNDGLAEIARLMGTGGTRYAYIELGTGATTPAASDTKLTNYIASTRARAGIISQTNYTATWTHTWTRTEFSQSGVLEAGIFKRQTADATGMLAHLRFNTVNKTNSDTLEIQWNVGVADDGV